MGEHELVPSPPLVQWQVLVFLEVVAIWVSKQHVKFVQYTRNSSDVSLFGSCWSTFSTTKYSIQNPYFSYLNNFHITRANTNVLLNMGSPCNTTTCPPTIKVIVRCLSSLVSHSEANHFIPKMTSTHPISMGEKSSVTSNSPIWSLIYQQSLFPLYICLFPTRMP